MSEHDSDPDFPPLWGDLETLCRPICSPVETGAGSVPARAHREAVEALQEVAASFDLMWRLLRDAPRLDGKFAEVDDMAGDAMRKAQAAVARFRRERDCGQALDPEAFGAACLMAMEG